MVVALAASFSVLVGAPAHAGEREACVAAAEHAQVLRDANKYRQAREQLLVCSRDVCPTVVKRDCAGWLNQLESVTPTIVLAAKQGTRDLTDVKVSVDGAALVETLDGTPIPMDPGPHTFTFEWSGDRREEKVIVGAGQKGRNIVVTFDSAGSTAQAPASSATASTRGPEETRRSRSLVPALVVGGVGILGLAELRRFLGISGSSRADAARRTSPPRCGTSRSVTFARSSSSPMYRWCWRHRVGRVDVPVPEAPVGELIYAR